MRMFSTILALLAILAQSLSPAGGCDHLLGCCCTADLLENSVALHAEEKAESADREDSAHQASNGECQLLATSRPAPKSCCAARTHSEPPEAAPAAASDLPTHHPGTHDCDCACHVPPPAAPIEVVRVASSSIEWLPLLPTPGSLNPAGLLEVSGFSSSPEVDDRTRPHRVLRCHLLDCLWLI